MNKLIILSPNDRYNYGDLLFSYIIQSKMAQSYTSFEIVSTIDSDMTYVGGEKVKALSSLSEWSSKTKWTSNTKCDLILGGGESLLTDWLSCYRFINENYSESLFLSLLQRICNKLYGHSKLIRLRNYIGRKKMTSITEYPYSVSKNELPFVRKIFYNSVGSSFLDKSFLSKEKINNLKKIDYISVRDKKSYEVLKSCGINVHLRPDSAILMSELFDNNFLEDKIKCETKKYTTNKEYIVFQINKTEGFLHFDELIDFFKCILNKTSYNICLCSIGYAPGHDDPIILTKINDDLNCSRVSNFSNNTIWDIMYLISKSKCFVGSSLHGVITAMSFSVPYLALYRTKTISYVELWGGDDLKVYNPNLNLYERFIKVLNADKKNLLTNRKQLISQATESFEQIKKIVNEP